MPNYGAARGRGRGRGGFSHGTVPHNTSMQHPKKLIDYDEAVSEVAEDDDEVSQ